MSGLRGQRAKSGPARLAVMWWTGGLAALAALLFAAAYLMRDNLHRELIKPDIPFQVDSPPPPPDYADVAAWVARPLGARAPRRANVFFVPPTTAYSGAEGWNAPIDDARAAERMRDIALPNHAAPYQMAGDLWVPRYRQAVLFALLSPRDDARDALDLAYGDVLRAWRAFLESRDVTRPFTLAGSGQGALHVLRLLGEPETVANWPSAIHIVGQPVALSAFQSGGWLAGRSLCRSEDQTGCILAFVQIDAGDDRDRDLLLTRGITWSPHTGYGVLGSEVAACVNPLNGGARPFAPPAANRGAAAARGLAPGETPPLLPGETGARCDRGGLVVEVNRPAPLNPPRFELGSRHRLTAYNLFFEALGSDAARRMKEAGR